MANNQEMQGGVWRRLLHLRDQLIGDGESKKTRLNRPISLLCLNCYLVPSLFTFKKENITCTLQEVRAKRVGQYAKDKDIIVLQEVWGSHMDRLQRELEVTHHILPGSGSRSLYGYGSRLLDPVRFWINKTGGLWFAQIKNISVLFHSKHTFTVSESWSMKGVQAVLLDMNNIWPEKYLLIFNTHLDPNSQMNRSDQLVEIHHFINRTIVDLKKFQHAFPQTFSFANCGVLLVGDFNVASSWKDDYQELTTLFKARDLHREYCKRTGKKELSTYDMANPLVPEIGESRKIDYIFALDAFSETSFLKLYCNKFVVETQEEDNLLSDHWPQVAHISPFEE